MKNSLLAVCFPLILLVSPRVLAGETASPVDLQTQWVGFYVLFVTVLAYVVAMTEDLHHMSKAKPMVMGAVLCWFAIFIDLSLRTGSTETLTHVFEMDLATYAELFLFITVSMTFLNTLTERRVFDVLRARLERHRFSYRQLFWITGVMAFVLSLAVSSLTVGLLMGYIILNLARGNSRFAGLAGLNAVIAANAGGTVSPLGGISTFFVWQQNMLTFAEFFTLFLPCAVNFLVPALCMHVAIGQGRPHPEQESVTLKRGSLGALLIFLVTCSITILSNVYLSMPAVLGMMFGLAVLQTYAYYLNVTEPNRPGEAHQELDIIKCIAGVDWDTLLFFYGAMMIIGAINYIGYLDSLAHFLFETISPTLANVLIGLASSSIDNGTLMYAVLTMHPALSKVQWLLLTLTLGVGGSLLAIGSAPGLHVLGLMKERLPQGQGYTFTLHLLWAPAILLGFFASVLTLGLLKGGLW